MSTAPKPYTLVGPSGNLQTGVTIMYLGEVAIGEISLVGSGPAELRYMNVYDGVSVVRKSPAVMRDAIAQLLGLSPDDPLLARFNFAFVPGSDATAPTPVPPAPVVTPAPPVRPLAVVDAPGDLMGVNLEAVVDYGRSRMFADLMKQARRWGTAEHPEDEKAQVDAMGWPIEDAGCYVITEAMRGVSPSPIEGRYLLTWEGTGTPDSPGAGIVTEKPGKAWILVPSGANQLVVRFTATKGGVRNVRLWQPGYEDGTRVFTDDFKKLLQPFQVLRCMDILHTNGSTVRSWAGRTRPEYATQAGPTGVAFEWLIQLANETGKDLWLNIPDAADADYVDQLGALVKKFLSPKRTLYVEYSNETWNGQFPQNAANIASAMAEQSAGTVNYDYDKPGGGGNKYYWGWRRNGEMSVRIAKALRPVFGDRLRVVLCAQIGWTNAAAPFEQYAEALKFIAHTYGAPSDFIWAIGSGSYLGSNPVPDTATPSQLLDSIKAASAWLPGATAGMARLARSYNLSGGHVAYEGGLDLTITQAQQGVHYLPEMKTFLVDLFRTGWFGQGAGLFCWYCAAGDFFGYSWGIVENTRVLNVPKFLALSEVAAHAAEWFTPVAAAPAPVPTVPSFPPGAIVLKASEYADLWNCQLETQSTGEEDIGYVSTDGAFAEWLVTAPAAGNYAVQLRASAIAEGDAEILINGAKVGRVTVPATGAWSAFKLTASAGVSLPAGVSRIQLSAFGGSQYNISHVVITKT